MGFFTIVEILTIMIFTAFLLQKYAAQNVPYYVWIPVYVTWFLCYSIVAIVPIDIFYTLHDTPENLENRETVEFVWNILYWITFILTWIILPFLQEFEDAGEFTTIGKVKHSLKINFIYYGIFAIFGIMFAVYYRYTVGLTWTNMVITIIAWANSFGICLITILLGFGLVILPKTYFYKSNHNLMLKYFQNKALEIDEARSNAQYDLEDIIKMVLLIMKKSKCSTHYKLICEKMLVSVPLAIIKKCKERVTYLNTVDLSDEIGEITDSRIVQLNKQIKKGIAELKRAECSWEILLEETFLLEDIIDNENSMVDVQMRSTYWFQRQNQQFNIFSDIISNTFYILLSFFILAWIWYTKIRKMIYLVLGIVCLLLSVTIILAECLQFSKSQLNILSLIGTTRQDFLMTQITSLLPLIYISFAVYWGLFKMKLAGFYGLYSNQQTDSASLIFATINFSRVTVPICFNFFGITKIAGVTSFQKAMGDLNLVPVFGNSFPSLFPLVLIILCILNIFDVYSKILGYLGLTQLEFSENINQQRIEAGKRLLARARMLRERKVLSSNSTNLKHFQGLASKFKFTPNIDLIDIESSNINKFRFSEQNGELKVYNAVPEAVSRYYWL